MLILGLRLKTSRRIIVVGNLDDNDIGTIKALGAEYIDENDIDLTDRLPTIKWTRKYRELGWYKQQLIRWSIDRFISTDYVLILDSEVFIFDNWNEENFFSKNGKPRYFYWISKKRKPQWDYQMYKGSAYLLKEFSKCRNILQYANSDRVKRYITGVQLFSRQNIAFFWNTLADNKHFCKNLQTVFSKNNDLVFSDYTVYGLAVEYGLFNKQVPTQLYNNLYGWYDNHDDVNFNKFKKQAMWSMCQHYYKFQNPYEYINYMKNIAQNLRQSLIKTEYWNVGDRKLINSSTYDNEKNVNYFKKYQKQLDFTFRNRFKTMFEALRLLLKIKKDKFTFVEIGTLRDNNIGGGHSTYKWAEFCSLFNGLLYSVDISREAVKFSQNACSNFLPWIKYSVSDSVEFLDKFSQQIDFLYLDGLDVGKDVKPAQEKQLQEIQAALPHLADKCIVLLDDAGLPDKGKTKLSSDFLKSQGFHLSIDDYQRLFVRGIKTNKSVKNVFKPQDRAGLVKISYLRPLNKEVYQDGAECFLWNMFKNKPESVQEPEIAAVLNSNAPWDVYYNLHPQRRHILDWYPFKKEAILLDVGAGTGAVTGVFLNKLKKITALELSPLRANILAHRFSDHDNLEVICGNIDKLTSDERYDYINMTGVLEYSGLFSQNKKKNPADSHKLILKKCSSLLKPGGKILIAIENPLGIRYLSGAVEDHCGELFEGVENYPQHDTVRTLTKTELTHALDQSGFQGIEFYYPLPDYKLPRMIMHQSYFEHNNQLSLSSLFQNFDPAHPLFRLFSEILFSYQLKKEKLLAQFANSFLVIAQRP
jgi:SAM-dependent methyltransferase